MIYSSRLKKILQVCLLRDEYVKVDVLAELLKISTRTVFREIKDVDKDLEDYGVHLVSKAGKGIKVSGSREDKQALLQELQTQEIQYINKEERQNLLIFELLRNDDVEKLLHYANLFQVSEATISNDLDTIEPWFEEYQIHLIRKPGKGVELQGDEAGFRRAMTEILNRTLHKKEDYESINYLDSQTLLSEIFLANTDSSIMKLLNRDILERILNVFHTYQHELNLDRYAQTSYIGLIIHLVIAIDRILKKEELQENEEVVAIVKDDSSFAQAKRMAHYLEIEFDIDIPEVETAFIALHIKGSKTTFTKGEVVIDEGNAQLYELIHNMLSAYDSDTALYLHQDEQLIHGLLTHLKPTITRLCNHLPIYNPLLKQIKKEYHTLFQQTKEACIQLQNYCGCEVSEDEVGFITMHIGASIERSQQNRQVRRSVRVGIVCASGIGVSALLSARIQKAFPYQTELHVLSMEEVLRHEVYDCELLISTFSIQMEDLPVLQVTPLLNCEDIKKIEEKLLELSSREVHREVVVPTGFKEMLKFLQEASTASLELLEHIGMYTLPHDIGITKMIEKASEYAGGDTILITQDLLARECQGSVIMKDYAFGLLHAKSHGIETLTMMVLYPDEELFTALEEPVSFMLVLLLPKNANRRQQEILSLMSRGLIEEDSYLAAIQSRDRTQIEHEVEALMQDYIEQGLEE